MSQVSGTPLLSVVVPIYNVGSYLAPCLESLTEGVLSDVQIICVDDGSTDGSGELADEFARRDPRISVLHVPNGGLGKARNIGAEHAVGRYLAFVDSDDRVPPAAYDQLCRSLEATGSDIAAGRVERFTDTSSWLSGLHRQAIKRPARATHITRTRSLVYDTTAWNKVFRRSFWDQHGFRFPEGVLYEDMGVTIPAHVLARSVDLLTSIVYEWRERGDGSLSITQRRAELRNLQDRLAALESVNDFLAGHDVPEVARAHDRKVLQLDLPLYLDVLDVADAEYRELFRRHVHDYLKHVDPEDLAQVGLWDRLAFELLLRDRLEETVELLQERRSRRRNYEVRRKRTRLYAELPFFEDAAVGLPDSLFDVTNKLPVHSSVDALAIRGTVLTVTGSALITKVGCDHAWSALRWLDLSAMGGRHRIIRPVLPRRRPDLTAQFGTAHAGCQMAGFTARIPLSRLRAPATGDATYAVQVKIVSSGARRGEGLGGSPAVPRPGPITIRPDGVHVAVYYNVDGWLRIAARRDYALAESVSFGEAGGRATIRLRFPHPPPADAVLRLRTDEDVPPIEAELTRDPSDPLRATAVFDFASSRLAASDETSRTWRPAFEPTEGPSETNRDQRTAVVVPSTFRVAEHYDNAAQRELAARVGTSGRLIFFDRPARAHVRSARWVNGSLEVTLTLPRWTSGVAFSLEHDSGVRLDCAELRRDEGQIIVRFDVLDVPRRKSILVGTWTLRVETGPERLRKPMPLEINEAAVTAAGSTDTDFPRAGLRVSGQRLSVHVIATRESDTGARNQFLRQTLDYAAARRGPLRGTILFQSWAGKQYSDSPRALYEQLRREGTDRPMLWVRRDTSVDVPDDVPSVIFGSREYFEALATARYVVSNDSMPTHYEKRSGSLYVQTWHGTPLKRIGFDIENAQFGNTKYLDEFALEVTKWDRLISPNPFSTEILRRAFNYQGEVLETGYPRNDVFYGPDADERRAMVRKRLGVLPGQRVVLWAPTWREDQRDNRGRYSLPLPFDLATWDRILRPDDLLLFRGHQLLQATVGGTLRGLRQVRNVTLYPEIQELYLATDVLITDYSSVMFDFANTRRPMIFYAWDLEHYRNELRGFYLDYEQVVPGPVVTDIATLSDALSDTPAATEQSAKRYQEFVERFCGLEDGHASERVIEAVFGR